MLIESRPCDDPELATLVIAQQWELRQGSGRSSWQGTPARDDARYLVGVINGRAVACGAIQSVDPDTAEISRLYVRPAHRGQGISWQLLAALEELAYQDGHSVLRVEAGHNFPEALDVYASCGYGQIPAYGDYVDDPYSVCFEKRLALAV